MLTTEPTGFGLSTAPRSQAWAAPQPPEPPSPFPASRSDAGVRKTRARLPAVHLSHSAAPVTNTPESWWLRSAQVGFWLTLPHSGPAGCGAMAALGPAAASGHGRGGGKASGSSRFCLKSHLPLPLPSHGLKTGPGPAGFGVGKSHLSLCQEFWQMASVTALHGSCPVPQTARSHHPTPL